MSDKIQQAFQSGNALHFASDGKVFRVRDNGLEPNKWEVVHFANVGTSEEFVEAFVCELTGLIDASMVFDWIAKP